MTDLSEMPDSSKGTECADAIAKLRSGKAMSQQDLADSLFVSRSLVAMWETGARTPDSYSLERMPTLRQETVYWRLTGTGLRTAASF